MAQKKKAALRDERIERELPTEKYLERARLTPQDQIDLSESSFEGLDEERVEKSRERNGSNEMARSAGSPWPKRLLSAFMTPFSLLLLVVAAVSIVIEFIPDNNGMSNAQTDPSWWVTPLVILVMVLLSGIISFVENTKSQHSSAQLHRFTENTSTVIRNGKASEMANSQIVVGDIVRLGAGDMVPADCRLIEAKDLFLNQSALNGESTPSEKKAEAYSRTPESLFDIPNLAFCGSSVVSGTASAIVLEVGTQTVLGHVSKKLAQKRGKTAFEKGISSITKLLMSFMAVMVPAVFIFRGLALNQLGDLALWRMTAASAENWLMALNFSISIAVGITPSLLPMQVASNLARGAVNMSKKKVIVKDINAIQNFGAMDVLCTDKTGTLTEGNSTLSDYIDFHEQIYEPLIRLAFLNARFQTGIRNPIDRSLIEYLDTKPDDEKMLLDRFEKLDEVPFDFQRKMLSILVRDRQEGRNLIVTKGFPGTVKDRIGRIFDDGRVRQATPADIELIKHTAEKYAALGTRVILLAVTESSKESISPEDENDLIFMGYVTFKDAPKDTAASAIKDLWAKGVRVKVLTGDSLAGSLALLEQTGFKDVRSLSGPKMAALSDQELSVAVEDCDLFVKLSPEDKERIVLALKKRGHVVGFMGDGINDASALRAADIGISFKEATDIAKEAADIIMLENDLAVLNDGIEEGRKAYINMMKYLKGQTSSNFGNMLSQLIGALWIPFIPMAPVQLIILDLITSISCACMPFDRVDPHMIAKPLRFDVEEIKWFMFLFGPISSIIDICTFALLFFFIAPNAAVQGQLIGSYQASWTLAAEGSLEGMKHLAFIAIFQTGFFIESLVTQNVVYVFLRTDRIPILRSRPSLTFGFSILVSVLIGFFVVYVPDVQSVFGFASHPDLPWIFLAFLLLLFAGYLALTQGMKSVYMKKFRKLL